MVGKVIYKVLLLPYVAICLLVLIIYVLLQFNISVNGLAGLTVLIYPFILLIFLVSIFIMLLVNWKMALPGILILLLNMPNMRLVFATHFNTHFKQEKGPRSLRVMTWNVRAFMPAHEQIYDVRKTSIEDILSNVEEWQPDVICLQEFTTYTRKYKKNLESIKKLGYTYQAFADQVLDGGELRTGIIIFSKYPIIHTETISIPETFADADEEPIIADIKIGSDTISVMNIHLQSYGFREHEYRDLAKIRSQEDEELRATKNIFRKMRRAFAYRNQQADLLSEKIKNSKYPLMVCGDLNDVPASYTYKTIKGDLKDAFLESGFGLGKSYVSGRSRVLSWLPTLRIDYIFHDANFNSTQIKKLTRHQSDHHGLIADLELPKNW